MPNIALISELSYHKIAKQKEELPGMTYYVAPDDFSLLFRATRREETLKIHVFSYAVVADNENAAREFVDLCKLRKIAVRSKKELSVWLPHTSPERFMDWWRSARKSGAAKAGGDAKSELSEKVFWERFAKIVDRWHLPSKGANANKPLLKEADTSRNTVKSYLGHTRVDWQGFSDARRRRILKEKSPWKKQ